MHEENTVASAVAETVGRGSVDGSGPATLDLGVSEDGVPFIDILQPPSVGRISLSFESACRSVDAELSEIAAAATAGTIARYGASDLSPIGVHSPGLANWDWRPYADLSRIRVVKALKALRSNATKGGRVLDAGSFFGNFARAARMAGYEVDALDDYEGSYKRAFDPFVDDMRGAGVTVLRYRDVGFDLSALPDEAYDAVLLMGVIEHIPHTPRELLLAVNRVLKPGGALILDTPNFGYLYNRAKVLGGRSAHPPIEHQFLAPAPFGGHHREFTLEEVRWMLTWLGHGIVEHDTFNLSIYGLSELDGHDAACWRVMERHPSLRETIFSVSRKPA